jgi:hypothetical protein
MISVPMGTSFLCGGYKTILAHFDAVRGGSTHPIKLGRGQNDTLRVFAVSFHDIQDGIFIDAKIAGNPTI